MQANTLITLRLRTDCLTGIEDCQITVLCQQNLDLRVAPPCDFERYSTIALFVFFCVWYSMENNFIGKNIIFRVLKTSLEPLWLSGAWPAIKSALYLLLVLVHHIIKLLVLSVVFFRVGFFPCLFGLFLLGLGRRVVLTTGGRRDTVDIRSRRWLNSSNVIFYN